MLSVCLLANLKVTLTSVCGQALNPIDRVRILNCVYFFFNSQNSKRKCLSEHAVFKVLTKLHSPQPESRVRGPTALRPDIPLTPVYFRGERESLLGPAADPLPQDRHEGSYRCPAVEAPAQASRGLSILLFGSRYGHLAHGSDGSVLSTNHTPGNPVTSPITNRSA